MLNIYIFFNTKWYRKGILKVHFRYIQSQSSVYLGFHVGHVQLLFIFIFFAHWNYFVCFFPHSNMKLTQSTFIYWRNTFQSWTTVWLVSGLMIPSSLGGRLSSNSFLSDPIRLVKSYNPLPLPSAFCFSHTLNDTPQLQIAFTRLSRCFVVFLLGGLSRFSFLSASKASWTRFLVSLSVEA